jgi:hypothetical protein
LRRGLERMKSMNRAMRRGGPTDAFDSREEGDPRIWLTACAGWLLARTG